MQRSIYVLLLAVVLGGCGHTATLSRGRGLHWDWGEDRLQKEGYPGYVDEYSSSGWGVLYDEDGIAYGPRSFYEGRTRLDHPYLTVNDTYLQSRWIRIYRSGCCTEALLGHYLEICDLAWHDVTGELNYKPTRLLSIVTPTDMQSWVAVSGLTDDPQPAWKTHLVSGRSLLIQPIDILFRRTLAAHAAYSAVTQSILDLKTHGRIPMWLREGISSYLANEGFEHLSFMGEFRAQGMSVLMKPAEVEANVYPLVDRTLGRIARYNSFLMVWTLSENYGWDRVVQTLDAVELGSTFDDAVETVYGIQTPQLLALLDPTVNGEPTTTRPQIQQ